MEIVEALSADAGTTCLVGAGGKKTTLYALAGRLDRAVLTATVRIPIFDRRVAALCVTDEPSAAVWDGPFPLGLVSEREGDRYLGYDTGTVDDLAATHDGPILVKADGARTRELKAPGEHEPQLPSTADVVVPVASVHAVGRPLGEETVHRPERVAALTDLSVGDPITPAAVATVLASEHGGLEGVPDGATAIPLLNKVDDADDERIAREIARTILARADVPRVVLARMADAEVVDVVTGVD